MEALDFIKLHSLYAQFSSMVENSYPLLSSHYRYREEEEDSFFDLEFVSPPPLKTCTELENELCFSKKGRLRHHHHHPSQSDLISKRKIIPFELCSKPESPVSVDSHQKSAPRLSISLFKKPKLKVEKAEVMASSRKLHSRAESKRFNFKLAGVKLDPHEATERPSKRFSKGRVQKYLKLIKPLYVKVSKRYNYRESAGASPAPTTSLASSSIDEKQRNIAIGIRVVSRHLRKCKSPSSTTAVSPTSTNRRDDSLLQQHDGIQSAILHCKRSFSSSRDAYLREDDVDGTNDQNPSGSDELQKQKAGKDVFSEAEEREEGY